MSNRKSMVEETLERIVIKMFREVLSSAGFPQWICRIGDFGEEAVCIEEDENAWIVYTGERGVKRHPVRFKYLDQACIEVFSRISSDQDTIALMTEEFNRLIRFKAAEAKQQMEETEEHNEEESNEDEGQN